MDSGPKTFGDWLREKRVAARLSLQDLADRIGVSKQRLSDIENKKLRTKGGQLPKLREDKVDELAKALFVPIEEARLAAGLSPHKPNEQSLQRTQILSYLEELPADQQEAAFVMIEALWRRQHAKRRSERQEMKKKRAG